MWRNAAKVGLATLGFMGIHSFFACRAVKQFVARRLGPRVRKGGYRAFYNAQALVSLGALYAIVRSIPDEVVYEVRGGPARRLLQAGQVTTVVLVVVTAHQVGLLRFSGLSNLWDWWRGAPLAEEPEAQGPAMNGDGSLRVRGLFRVSRHPLNLLLSGVLWLSPRMTRHLLTFSTLSTLYVIVGSYHEETRLRAAYGTAYQEYQNSGIPFLL
jgi:protein-S-isoprenylcysteine O-methyltransferase Ste14